MQAEQAAADYSLGIAAGLGSAALAYLADSQERSDDFELWLVTATQTAPGWQSGYSMRETIDRAKYLCALVSRRLGVGREPA